jgi:hypothetical protein
MAPSREKNAMRDRATRPVAFGEKLLTGIGFKF